MPDSDESWHLDKRVPIALIFAMVAQAAVVVWGAAVITKDIEANRNKSSENAETITVLDRRLRASERATGNQAVQLGRIEEQISGMRDDIGRLLQLLERRIE